MKITIMTDMEGVAGVLNHDDWVLPEGRFYAKGMRLLTEEVNAAVEGLCSAGADEVLVVDGHGAGGIDPEILDERALLRRGRGENSRPWVFASDTGDTQIMSRVLSIEFVYCRNPSATSTMVRVRPRRDQSV